MAVLVAALMIAATMVPAWAATAGTYVITIRNALAGETYTAYKIFDMQDGRDTAEQIQTYVSTADATYQADKAYYTKSTESTPGGNMDVYTRLTNYTVGSTISGTVYELDTYVAYTIPQNSAWYTKVSGYGDTTTGTKGLILKTAPGYTPATDVVTIVQTGTNAFDPADFATYLKSALDAGQISSPEVAGSGTGTPTTGNGETASSPVVTIDVSTKEAGYYLISTSLGAIVALDSANRTIDAYEKNTTPSLTKKIKDTADGSYGTGDVELNVGDRVYFEIEVTDGKGTNSSITVKDKMDAGLTLDPTSFAVKKSGTAVATERYTIKVNDSTKVTQTHSYADTTDNSVSFEVVFDDTYVKNTLLTTDDKVVITYQAILNKDAVIYNSSDQLLNTNKANLKYSNQNTVEQQVNARTHAFKVKKVDKTNSNPLGGVQFKLTKTVSGATYYYSEATETTSGTVVTTGATWGATPAFVTTSSEDATKGEVLFTGLEAGEYILTETEAAPGFTPLTDTITITVNTNGTISYKATGATGAGTTVSPTGTEAGNNLVLASFNVENTPGTALPATGGSGTVVLYIVGGMLVILAGAYLFFSRKKTA